MIPFTQARKEELEALCRPFAVDESLSLPELFEQWRPAIDHALDVFVPLADIPHTRVAEAMRYSLKGGKRLRPILALLASQLGDGDYTLALPAALAVECIHVYSLVHDDLPCMDDDDLRRGRATNHKVYGEAVALLAGDGLLTHAFELVCTQLPPERAAPIAAHLAASAGYRGMIAGQDLDMQAEGDGDTDIELQSIHKLKTGALIRAAVMCGARACGADSRTLAALSRYGAQIGLAFQIADDILDVTASTEVLGKPAGSDLERDKRTYPALHGLDGARKLARNAVRQAKLALATQGSAARRLLQVADFIIERET